MVHLLGRTRALALLPTTLLTVAALGPAPPAVAVDTAGISGRVTNYDGAVDNADVTVYRLEGGAFQPYTSAVTDAVGNYVVGGLPAGTYRAQFYDAQADIGEYWNDKDTLETADDIVLADGQVASIDVFLSSYTTQRVVANRTPPTIVGTPQVGLLLTATPGTWSPADATVTYTWLVEGGSILDAPTGPTYIPTSADVGKTITVMAAGSYPGYWAGFGFSLPTAPVTSAAPPPMVITNTGMPEIKGILEVGHTVRVTEGSWAPSTVSLTYQWYAGGNKIWNATRKKLTLTAELAGKRLTVEVTAAAPGYTGLTVQTKPSARVKP